eukprot:Filipodium_phascolosomae@DN5262_c0_g1_i1.p1
MLHLPGYKEDLLVDAIRDINRKMQTLRQRQTDVKSINNIFTIIGVRQDPIGPQTGPRRAQLLHKQEELAHKMKDQRKVFELELERTRAEQYQEDMGEKTAEDILEKVDSDQHHHLLDDSFKWVDSMEEKHILQPSDDFRD